MHRLVEEDGPGEKLCIASLRRRHVKGGGALSEGLGAHALCFSELQSAGDYARDYLRRILPIRCMGFRAYRPTRDY